MQLLYREWHALCSHKPDARSVGKLFENRLLYRAGFQIDINKISLKLGKFVYRKKISNASRRVERGDKEN